MNYYGYARSTGDLDIWIGTAPENVAAVVAALREFGFSEAAAEAFDGPNRMVRMGVPPLRLKILTAISGVEFADCYARRALVKVDGEAVPLIDFEDLKRNKRAGDRPKDLADLDELE